MRDFRPLGRLAAMDAGGRTWCLAGTATDSATSPMSMNTAGGQVPVPANCVTVCPPAKDMTVPGRFVVNDLNKMEAISQPLYDYLAYPAAGQLQFTFFQVPVGGAKTQASTNMDLGGQLPAPQKLLISGIAIDFLSGFAPIVGPQADASISNINDIYAVLNNLAGVNGFFTLKIGSKQYLQVAPLMVLPPRSHMNGVMAVTSATTAAASLQTLGSLGFADGDVFRPVPLLIEAGQNFSATINFPSLVALPSANTHSQIGVWLYGTLYRAPQ